MENEIEKAYYNEMIKDSENNQDFESLYNCEKRWFTDTLSFKLFVVRWHCIRLYEQVKTKLFN